jgi:hypothetical protein
MQETIEGYNRAIFHYIKDIVDYAEKTKRGLPVDNVNVGFSVITNVYMLSLMHYSDIARASELAGDAISVFIDFIVQMSNIGSANSTTKITVKDAAMFVYKKVLPKEKFFTSSSNSSFVTSLVIYNEENSNVDDTNLKSPANMQIIPASELKNILVNMRIYTSIIRNLIQSLFIKNMFYDDRTDTISYYSQIITSMIHLIIMIEKNSSKLSIQSMNYIINQQLAYKVPCYPDTSSASTYISWIENMIYEKVNA